MQASRIKSAILIEKRYIVLITVWFTRLFILQLLELFFILIELHF